MTITATMPAGFLTSTPAIHVYINSAAPAASASAIPAHLEGVPVEVIETDEFNALKGS